MFSLSSQYTHLWYYSFMSPVYYVSALNLRSPFSPPKVKFYSHILSFWLSKAFIAHGPPDWNQATVFILYIWKNVNMIRIVRLKSLSYIYKKGNTSLIHIVYTCHHINFSERIVISISAIVKNAMQLFINNNMYNQILY